MVNKAPLPAYRTMGKPERGELTKQSEAAAAARAVHVSASKHDRLRASEVTPMQPHVVCQIKPCKT